MADSAAPREPPRDRARDAVDIEPACAKRGSIGGEQSVAEVDREVGLIARGEILGGGPSDIVERNAACVHVLHRCEVLGERGARHDPM